MPEARAVIFANGKLPNIELTKGILRPGDTLIAADNGATHLLKMGLVPDLLVGDMDSLPAKKRQLLESGGVRILRHPRDKDQTDLELAITQAIESGFEHILVVAALGGRLDMTLSNLSLLTKPDLLNLDVRLDDGLEEAFIISRQATITGTAGEIVSLLTWGEKPAMVTTTRLRWSLKDDYLQPGSTRGVSNEMLTSEAQIQVNEGMILCIHRRRTNLTKG